MILTRDLKIKFLGITPVLKDKTGVLNPQEIVSLSALLTFKGKSIKQLFKDIQKKEGKIDQKIIKILQKSSLRGHASIATTPGLCLAYESSKFLDSALTGIVFSSSLVASGRRTDTTEKDVVFPQKIFSNKKARKIYKEVSGKIIKNYNFFLSENLPKDEVSKVLQYGIYGTGIIQLPVESVVALKREYELEIGWMPEEIGMLLKKIEKETKKMGVNWLFATRQAAPRNFYPYPNIFKDPKNSNIVRELKNKIKVPEGTKIISTDILITPDLKKRLNKLQKITRETFSSLKKIKNNWPNLLNLRQEILRDHNGALRFKVLSVIPWRIWGEKKRHRTVPQTIESIYFCVDRAGKKFKEFKGQIKKGKIQKKALREIEEVFSVPPSIKSNPDYLKKYLLTALEAFEGYNNLIKFGIKPKDAVFLIPRGVKIDILQDYDLYNLLAGYYPLRLCQTAEEEMRRNTVKEIVQIKKVLKQENLGWLNSFLGPKCEMIGFCPEEKSCGNIKRSVRNYSDKFHEEMKEDLRKRFEKNLKNLK